MGLDTSHEAFHGPYSSFDRMRRAVSWAVGGNWPEVISLTDDFDFQEADKQQFPPDQFPGLYEFLNHSDCDGQISPNMCYYVARDLAHIKLLVADLEQTHPEFNTPMGSESERLQQFIDGCWSAYYDSEPLEFR